MARMTVDLPAPLSYTRATFGTTFARRPFQCSGPHRFLKKFAWTARSTPTPAPSC